MEGLFLNYRVCKAYGLGYVSGSIYCALHYLTQKGITQISTSLLKEYVLEGEKTSFYNALDSLQTLGLVEITPVHKGLNIYHLLDPKHLFAPTTSSATRTISAPTQETSSATRTISAPTQETSSATRTISSATRTILKEKNQKKNNIKDKNDGGYITKSTTTTTTDSSLIFNGIPTLEIIKRFGEMNPKIPEHVLLQFFHRYEMIGWVYNGREIRNWKYPWERFYESWIKYQKKDDERAIIEQSKQKAEQAMIANHPQESDWARYIRKQKESEAQEAYLAAHPEEKPMTIDEYREWKKNHARSTQNDP